MRAAANPVRWMDPPTYTLAHMLGSRQKFGGWHTDGVGLSSPDRSVHCMGPLSSLGYGTGVSLASSISGPAPMTSIRHMGACVSRVQGRHHHRIRLPVTLKAWDVYKSSNPPSHLWGKSQPDGNLFTSHWFQHERESTTCFSGWSSGLCPLASKQEPVQCLSYRWHPALSSKELKVGSNPVLSSQPPFKVGYWRQGEFLVRGIEWIWTQCLSSAFSSSLHCNSSPVGWPHVYLKCSLISWHVKKHICRPKARKSFMHSSQSAPEQGNIWNTNHSPPNFVLFYPNEMTVSPTIAGEDLCFQWPPPTPPAFISTLCKLPSISGVNCRSLLGLRFTLSKLSFSSSFIDHFHCRCLGWWKILSSPNLTVSTATISLQNY